MDVSAAEPAPSDPQEASVGNPLALDGASEGLDDDLPPASELLPKLHLALKWAGHGNWPRLAVPLLLLALALSVELGWLDESIWKRADVLMQRAGLPLVPPPSMNVDQFLQLMGRDKKVIDGKIVFILAKSIGDTFISKNLIILCSKFAATNGFRIVDRKSYPGA